MLTVSIAVGLFGSVGTPPAGAATQIGQTFLPDQSMGAESCSGGFTRLQGTSPNAQYAAPTDGVITAWRYEAGLTPSPLRFKVAHPEGGNSFTIIGESDLKTPIASQLNTYTDVRVRVRAGDVIGLYLTNDEPCFREVSGYQENPRSGDFTPGTTASFDIDLPNINQLDIAATLESDCDADGFGDETQDPDISACNPPEPGKQSRLLTLDANKNKVKKGKIVTLSGRLSPAARQGPCESGQTVELQRKKPKQTSFTTFAQVQTDAQGSFSLKKKLKKTFEFRAQVVETPACIAALSNTEKVKVQKR